MLFYFRYEDGLRKARKRLNVTTSDVVAGTVYSSRYGPWVLVPVGHGDVVTGWLNASTDDVVQTGRTDPDCRSTRSTTQHNSTPHAEYLRTTRVYPSPHAKRRLRPFSHFAGFIPVTYVQTDRQTTPQRV